MKIAYIVNNFPALSETFVINEVLELSKRGFDIHIFARWKQDLLRRTEDMQKLTKQTYYFNENSTFLFKKIYLHMYFLARNPIRYIKASLFAKGLKSELALWHFRQSVFLAKQIIDAKITHIHAHFANLTAEYAMFVSKLAGIPYSFTAHAVGIFVEPKFIKEKVNNAKFVAAISNYNKQYLIKNHYGIKADKIKVIHCGIRTSFADNITREQSNGFHILAVGRLVRKKGFKYLIDACDILRRKHNLDFKCEIVGEGPERINLQHRIFKNRLQDAVDLKGALPHKDVLKKLGRTSIFVLPSVTDEDNNAEGIPVSLMEAMAARIPVVSSRLTGIPELVKGGAGVLVPEKDTNALADTIRYYFYAGNDQRNTIGQLGRKIVQAEFNVEHEVEKLAGLFTNGHRIFS